MKTDTVQQRKDFIRSAAKEAGGKLCDAIENHFGRPQVTSPIGKEYPWHVVVRWIVDGREWVYDELYFDDAAPSASFLEEFMARAVSCRDYEHDVQNCGKPWKHTK